MTDRNIIIPNSIFIIPNSISERHTSKRNFVPMFYREGDESARIGIRRRNFENSRRVFEIREVVFKICLKICTEISQNEKWFGQQIMYRNV